MSKTTKEITAEIKELKTKHPDQQFFKCTVWIENNEAEERTLILTKPTRHQRTAGEKASQDSSVKGGEIFLRSMHVGGDDLDEVLQNDEAFYSAIDSVVEIIAVKKANLHRV